MELKEVFIKNANLQYFVNEIGEVFSKSRKTGNIKKIKQYERRDGYKFVNILNNKVRKTEGKYKGNMKNRTIYVHRMIVAAFKSDGDYYFEGEANHKDYNPSNNNLSNLEILTPQENILHRYLKNDKYSFVYKRLSKKTPYGVRIKSKLYGNFATAEEASRVAYKYFIDNNLEIPKYSKFA